MNSGESGSVFIEALVATAIVAVVLGGVFRVTADSVARHRMVNDRRYALLIARSQMAAAGFAIPFASGVTEGTDGEDIWRVDMRPCPSSDSAASAGTLYCIAVSVRNAREGAPLITLSSRRLAPPPGA